MNEKNRGTGRTTRQMIDAPHGAVFVWCNDVLFYPKNLARKINRSDLKIVSPSWLEFGVSGKMPKTIVVDHAAKLTTKQTINLSKNIEAVIRMRNGR